MTLIPLSVEMHLYQWLRTAGDFQVNLAWQTDRLQIRCKCGAILRCEQLSVDGDIPWVLQDWVATHGHNGNHGVESKPIMKVTLAPVPLTADFKKISTTKISTAKIAHGRRFR